MDKFQHIFHDADGHLDALPPDADADALALRYRTAAPKLPAMLAHVQSLTPAEGEKVPDPIEHLQNALDNILYEGRSVGISLRDMIDRSDRNNSLTLTFLALSYAREAIVDVAKRGIEPEPFAGWPRLWQAMLSPAARHEHGDAVHAGYLIDLGIIGAAENLLFRVQKALEPDDDSRPIASACIELFNRCPIPYRDVARKIGEEHLYLLRSQSNPAILLLNLSAENPTSIE